jgi:intracellular septation protein
MRTALYQLGEDFLSTIVFLIVYFVSGVLYLAIAVAMGVGIGQFLLLKRRGRNPDIMGWLSLVMVIALGGASLITNDSRFTAGSRATCPSLLSKTCPRTCWSDPATHGRR